MIAILAPEEIPQVAEREVDDALLIPLAKLSRDLADASRLLSVPESRFLVDMYYAIQDDRKAFDQQQAAAGKQEPDSEPSELMAFLGTQTETVEGQIRRALGKFAESQQLGRWALSIHGIGPVIAAGLLAHIDFNRLNKLGGLEMSTASHLWSFAGLNPNAKWEKGNKRPWNARLKVLAWKIGQSFVKQSNNPKCVYGHLYRARMAQEIARNDAGLFAGQAAAKLERYNIGKDTAAYGHYSAGKLPPAHLQARAARYAEKMFFAHYFEVGYEITHGVKPPRPWAIAHGGHADYMPPPNWPMTE